MPDLKRVLRDLANAYEKEEEGESSKALTDRIERLEATLAGKQPTPRQVEDAAEELELDDDELEAVKAFLKERRDAAPKSPDGEGKPDETAVGDVPVKRTRPGRKSGQLYKWTVGDDGTVQELDIPTVYNGTDEEDQVELPEGEAA